MFHKRGLSAAVTVMLVLAIVIAAALSFIVGQSAIRLVTITQTTSNLVTVTTTAVSISTVTVTTIPPDYFQVNGIALYSGTASNRESEGTASIQFSVTGPLPTESTVSAGIIAINISNSSFVSYPLIYQCASSFSCTVVSEAVVRDYGVTNFNSPSTAFYIGARIISGDSYDYNVIFSNGNSVEGTVVAQ
jgi:hypothetical protein